MTSLAAVGGLTEFFFTGCWLAIRPRLLGLGDALGPLLHQTFFLLATLAQCVEAPQQVRSPIAIGQLFLSPQAL